MIFFAICFYPKFKTISKIDFSLLLERDINAIPEYRETTEELFNNLMLSTFDAGDQNGLRVDANGKIKQNATNTFKKMVAKGGYYYCVFNPTEKVETVSTIGRTVCSQTTGKLVIPDTMELCYYWDATTRKMSAGNNYSLANIGTGAYKPVAMNSKKLSVVLMVYKQEYAQNSGVPLKYQKEVDTYSFILCGFIASFALFILFFLLSMLKRKSGKIASQRVAYVTEYIFPEVKLLLVAGTVTAIVYLLPMLRDNLGEGNTTDIILQLFYVFGLALILSLVKNDVVYNKCLIFRMSFLAIIIRAIRRFSEAGKWERKYIILSNLSFLIGIIGSVAGIILLTYQYAIQYFSNHYRVMADYVNDSMLLIGYICLAIGVLFITLSIMNANRLRKEAVKVSKTIAAMRHGETQAQLTLPQHAYLKQTATDINELEKGIEQAVEQKGKADRMRVELITNVSHDLKTPLTSIINYADLLCEEPLDEKTKQYATAIQEKSYHLKNMVQDVFELSKASTGNLVLEKHTLDIVKLLRQTLADIDEKIAESTLTFRTQIPEESALIEGDGDKLYRVFLNLYMNAIHYSLENSRVYTTVQIADGHVIIKIKNTSKNEMEFDNEEIMERFVRADKSRTGEGSGLGLSIVKSFTEACDGTFQIETDADMFTAITIFPLNNISQDIDSETIQGEINEMVE